MIITPKLYVTKEEMDTIKDFMDFLDKMNDKEYSIFIEECASPEFTQSCEDTEFYHIIENLLGWAEEQE